MLVRHSLPDVVPGAPPSHWQLSDEGRARCVSLAASLSAFTPRTVFASHEPKAAETARIVGERLGAEVTELDGLEEHHRDDAPFFQDPGEFDAAVRRLFAASNELVYGSETATEALTRFERAVTAAIDAESDSDVVVVSHGTVISLLIAGRTGLDPMEVWRGLTTPCYAVVELPGFKLLDIVSDIA